MRLKFRHTLLWLIITAISLGALWAHHARAQTLESPSDTLHALIASKTQQEAATTRLDVTQHNAAQHKATQEQHVQNHTQNAQWQLVFVFADWCPYCHATAPVVQAWSERYHIPVRAVSITGKGLPGFPRFDTITPQEQASWFHGSVRVPAMLAQNRAHPEQLRGLATGALTSTQLTSLWQQATLPIPSQ
ncbi:conjugal transfer protein TraF [Vibrio mediterranei]